MTHTSIISIIPLNHWPITSRDNRSLLRTGQKNAEVLPNCLPECHDDVMPWTRFPSNWPSVWEIKWWSVDFPHKKGCILCCKPLQDVGNTFERPMNLDIKTLPWPHCIMRISCSISSALFDTGRVQTVITIAKLPEETSDKDISIWTRLMCAVCHWLRQRCTVLCFRSEPYLMTENVAFLVWIWFGRKLAVNMRQMANSCTK